MSPSLEPTFSPSVRPTRVPSPEPTSFPVIGAPTRAPTFSQPSRPPTQRPTNSPTKQPVLKPTFAPSFAPTEPMRVLLQVTQTFQGIDTNNFNENAKASLKDAIALTLGCDPSSVTIVSISPSRRILYNEERELSSGATIVYTVNLVVAPGQSSSSTYNQAIAVMSNPTTLSNNLISQGFSSITVQSATVSNISPTHEPTPIPTQIPTDINTQSSSIGVDVTSMIIGFVIIIPIAILLVLRGKFCMSSIEHVMKYAKNDIQNNISLQEESKMDPDEFEFDSHYKPKSIINSLNGREILYKPNTNTSSSVKSSKVVPLLEPPDALLKNQSITTVKRIALPPINSSPNIKRTSSSPIRQSPSKPPPPSSSSSSSFVDPVHALPSDIHIVKAMIANSSKGYRNSPSSSNNNSNNNNNNNSNSTSKNGDSNRQKRLPPMPIREY